VSIERAISILVGLVVFVVFVLLVIWIVNQIT